MTPESVPSVLVCGAGGFIGGHLVRRLVSMGVRVRAVDKKALEDWHQISSEASNRAIDLSDAHGCREAVLDVTSVYNFASDMGGMGFIESNRALCMLNVLINTHLLDAAREAGVERFFFASSACVYPLDRQQAPDAAALKEPDAYPAMPEDGYGWEKLFGERLCRHFLEDFGVGTRVARFHNVYGPQGAWRGGREKAPAAICRKVIQAKRNRDPTIEIWGDGRQARSFTWIDDAVEGTVRLMKSECAEPVNVGSSERVTLDGLVDIVEHVAGVRLKRVYLVDAPRGVGARNSDNTFIREQLGWEPSTALQDGIEKTYRWIYDEMARSGAI